MIKPWHEWIFILFPGGGETKALEECTDDQYVEHIKTLIGDASVSVDVLGISKWIINEIVAEQYSRGNVFCLGDAVHRHPPMNGLGANTCIQDAYNLAWKVAYVERGLASSDLLETYNTERQPVGLGIVTRANEAFGFQSAVWQAMGITTDKIPDRKAALDELAASTEGGRIRRKAFHDAIRNTNMEFQGLGIEMGQYYQSNAVINETVDGVPVSDPRHKDTQVLRYVPSTQPGRRLPHVWLNSACPTEFSTSTQDLAGKGRFCIFTGHGGQGWKTAAANVRSNRKLDVSVHTIGFGLEWEDVYFDWENVRGVEESGCVLVRPDRIVAWRCAETLSDVEKCTKKLMDVLGQILGWKIPIPV
ncbi:hypothetical protein LTR95_003396 [Oleoguttula sp. CCFEE 5521]